MASLNKSPPLEKSSRLNRPNTRRVETKARPDGRAQRGRKTTLPGLRYEGSKDTRLTGDNATQSFGSHYFRL
jgi:hypothetical protein